MIVIHTINKKEVSKLQILIFISEAVLGCLGSFGKITLLHRSE